MAGQALSLTPAYTMLRVTSCTALVWLSTLIPIECSAFELAKTFEWISKIIAIVNTTIPTAVTAIPITLFLIIFAVARTISYPYIDAGGVSRLYILIKDNFIDEPALIVPIVDNTSLWEIFVWENLCARTPSKPKAKPLL
jgi:hypothetical protein